MLSVHKIVFRNTFKGIFLFLWVGRKLRNLMAADGGSRRRLMPRTLLAPLPRPLYLPLATGPLLNSQCCYFFPWGSVGTQST